MTARCTEPACCWRWRSGPDRPCPAHLPEPPLPYREPLSRPWLPLSVRALPLSRTGRSSRVHLTYDGETALCGFTAAAWQDAGTVVSCGRCALILARQPSTRQIQESE